MNSVSVRNLFVAGSVLLLAFTPISSAYAEIVGPAAAAVEPAAAVETATDLSPGEFVWQPERSPVGEVEIVVSIPLQRAYVYRGGTLIGVTTVSTGKPGHRTPTGKFDILQKRAKHFSNLYNNAPMPFMQRLTWGGIALHAGQIPGRPASHGCVRLPLAFARNLFSVTSMGGSVHIVDRSPAPQEALATVRGNGAHAGMGGPLEEIPAGTD
jgi:lipoprotein-anchoring transpeptidase ErfK/SrfK